MPVVMGENDKAGVGEKAPGFEKRLNAAPDSSSYMPQGRVLPASDRNRIIELAAKIFGQ